MSTATLLRDEGTVTAVGRSRPSVGRRVIAILLMFIGAAFVAVTLIVNLFRVGPAFERMTDGFRPAMSQQAIQTDRADIAALSNAGKEFQTKLAPALAQQLGMSQKELNVMMTTKFPATAAGMAAIPKIVPTFNGLVSTLDQQRPLFRSADAIPTKNLSAATLPLGLLVVGLLTFSLGAYAWFAPRAGAVIAVALGAALIAVPLLLSLPQKAADADQMNTNLKPVYTQQTVDQGATALATLTAMGTEMQTKMLPAVASQLNMSPTQFRLFIVQNFPLTAAALANLPGATERFGTLVDTFQQHLSDYNTLKPVSLVPIVWMVIVGGIGLVLLGGAGLVISRR